MIQLPQEQAIERFDTLPERLREAITSNEGLEMLLKIGEVHHLSEERIEKIIEIITYVMLGATHLEDLSKEIAAETNVDRRLANELAREIQVKVLAPLIPEIQKLYHYGTAGTDTPSAPSASFPATPTQSEIMRPAFAPAFAEASAGKPPLIESQPFILHEERAEVERARPKDETLVRPSFYEGAETGNRKQETGFERMAARLEMGPSASSGQEERREPRVGRTEEPQVRVVHYTGPQTPVDPFAPGQEARSMNHEASSEESPFKPPEDIHPENIVDLKDLPK